MVKTKFMNNIIKPTHHFASSDRPCERKVSVTHCSVHTNWALRVFSGLGVKHCGRGRALVCYRAVLLPKFDLVNGNLMVAALPTRLAKKIKIKNLITIKI